MLSPRSEGGRGGCGQTERGRGSSPSRTEASRDAHPARQLGERSEFSVKVCVDATELRLLTLVHRVPSVTASRAEAAHSAGRAGEGSKRVPASSECKRN